MIAIFPQIANLVANGDLEKLACMVRKYFGASQAFAPILNVGRLMVNAGIEVQDLDFDGVGALLAEDSKGRFRVKALVNGKAVEKKERNILLAHLLGHFLLHVQPEIAKGEGGRYGFQESVSPLQRLNGSNAHTSSLWNNEQDRQADLFAIALLLPVGMIQRAASKLSSLEKMGSFFGLAPQLVHFRLNQLLANDNQATAATINEHEYDPKLPPSTSDPSSPTSEPHHIPGREIKQNSTGDLEMMAEQTAIVRGQRLMADHRYRAQPNDRPKTLMQESSRPSQSLEGGLRKLRQIAKRLDSSVKL